MSAESEKLAGIIGGKLITRASMTETADAVLAAGWRPPAVTIKTEMGLQALVDGIVLLDADGDVYRKNTTLDHDGTPIAVFWQAGPQGRFRTVALPATVLYEP
jgi:hypothetical protein